jgi:hypothetical protein
MKINNSNTVAKQSKRPVPKQLKPFVKGDPRINRKGRPKSFDQLRNLFQDIAAEEITINGKKYTRAKAIGIAMSMDKKLMREFLEFAFGKVPQALTLENGETPLVFRIVHDDTGRVTDTSAEEISSESDASDTE